MEKKNIIGYILTKRNKDKTKYIVKYFNKTEETIEFSGTHTKEVIINDIERGIKYYTKNMSNDDYTIVEVYDEKFLRSKSNEGKDDNIENLPIENI